jgi:hypothetical protein
MQSGAYARPKDLTQSSTTLDANKSELLRRVFQMFSKAVTEHLRYYVYRLIDPRNGETFYIGKGTGNRVFAHAKDELRGNADDVSEKLKRIRAVRNDGFDVLHVIHRHGMDESTAIEVEAALIDAYPEATNLAGGRASDERGLMHSSHVIERYEAKEAKFKHKTIIININRTAAEKGIYDAVRFAWKLDPKRAEKADLVVAVIQGLIVGVFISDRWMEATKQNFAGIAEDSPGRWGFIGHAAPVHIAKLYLRKRLPDSMRKRGAANPI